MAGQVILKPPNFKEVAIRIRGTTPLIVSGRMVSVHPEGRYGPYRLIQLYWAGMCGGSFYDLFEAIKRDPSKRVTWADLKPKPRRKK